MFHWFDYLKWIYIIGSFLICTALLIRLCYQFEFQVQPKSKRNRKRNNKKKKDEPFHLKLISVAGIFFYDLTLVFYVIGEIFYHSTSWIGIPYTCVSLMWGCANTCIYLLFIGRLYQIFNHTTYSSSMRVYVSLAAGMFVFWCAQMGVGLIALFDTRYCLSLSAISD
jgi:Na+/H+ antiporter NhaD/arsenite permease-like protein